MAAASKGEMSSFSQTCSLLSRYLKEKKANLGALTLGMMTSDRKPLAARTMSLLPGLEQEEERNERSPPKSIHLFPQNPPLTNPTEEPNNASGVKTEKEERQRQLTIFYGGKVLVFDDFPAEKAENLMEMATEPESISAQNFRLSSSSSAVAAASRRASPYSSPESAAAPPPPDKTNASNMPIPRKNSLHRFLEKRKYRISSNGPYQLHSSWVPTPTKSMEEGDPESGPAWLNLGKQARTPVVGLEEEEGGF